ncbi:MAG: hypothetical protein AVDCRST_MAG60-1927 [uncultured Nocardioides sp.]|uniref:Bacterial Ig-like domain-containing protein n=1 Tax=uncultured Nocardioides sp. TaxID=198441 RepID=A0A6J4NV21_9ACTN|nr:MAG: hypothetical protein AVDCRST_MAG60-1927 [uncultured Nocardioides sp.]
MTASARTNPLLATGLAVVLTGGTLAAAAPAQAQPGSASAAAVVAAKAVSSSTTVEVSSATVEFGAPVTAVAEVATTSGTPAGEVTFVVGGLATKVAVSAGVATLRIRDAVRGLNTVSATFTPSDTTTYEGSAASPTSFTVTKADTTTRLRVSGKRVGEGTSATVMAIGFHRTVPNGKARLVLRRVGQDGILQRRQGKLGAGSRGFTLGKLDRGRYTAVVRYLGDDNHRRSKMVKSFFVRR